MSLWSQTFIITEVTIFGLHGQLIPKVLKQKLYDWISFQRLKVEELQQIPNSSRESGKNSP